MLAEIGLVWGIYYLYGLLSSSSLSLGAAALLLIVVDKTVAAIRHVSEEKREMSAALISADELPSKIMCPNCAPED